MCVARRCMWFPLLIQLCSSVGDLSNPTLISVTNSVAPVDTQERNAVVLPVSARPVTVQPGATRPGPTTRPAITTARPVAITKSATTARPLVTTRPATARPVATSKPPAGPSPTPSTKKTSTPMPVVPVRTATQATLIVKPVPVRARSLSNTKPDNSFMNLQPLQNSLQPAQVSNSFQNVQFSSVTPTAFPIQAVPVDDDDAFQTFVPIAVPVQAVPVLSQDFSSLGQQTYLPFQPSPQNYQTQSSSPPPVGFSQMMNSMPPPMPGSPAKIQQQIQQIQQLQQQLQQLQKLQVQQQYLMNLQSSSPPPPPPQPPPQPPQPPMSSLPTQSQAPVVISRNCMFGVVVDIWAQVVASYYEIGYAQCQLGCALYPRCTNSLFLNNRCMQLDLYLHQDPNAPGCAMAQNDQSSPGAGSNSNLYPTDNLTTGYTGFPPGYTGSSPGSIQNDRRQFQFPGPFPGIMPNGPGFPPNMMNFGPQIGITGAGDGQFFPNGDDNNGGNRMQPLPQPPSAGGSPSTTRIIIQPVVIQPVPKVVPVAQGPQGGSQAPGQVSQQGSNAPLPQGPNIPLPQPAVYPVVEPVNVNIPAIEHAVIVPNGSAGIPSSGIPAAPITPRNPPTKTPRAPPSSATSPMATQDPSTTASSLSSLDQFTTASGAEDPSTFTSESDLSTNSSPEPLAPFARSFTAFNPSPPPPSANLDQGADSDSNSNSDHGSPAATTTTTTQASTLVSAVGDPKPKTASPSTPAPKAGGVPPKTGGVPPKIGGVPPSPDFNPEVTDPHGSIVPGGTFRDMFNPGPTSPQPTNSPPHITLRDRAPPTEVPVTLEGTTATTEATSVNVKTPLASVSPESSKSTTALIVTGIVPVVGALLLAGAIVSVVRWKIQKERAKKLREHMVPEVALLVLSAPETQSVGSAGGAYSPPSHSQSNIGRLDWLNPREITRGKYSSDAVDFQASEMMFGLPIMNDPHRTSIITASDPRRSVSISVPVPETPSTSRLPSGGGSREISLYQGVDRPYTPGINSSPSKQQREHSMHSVSASETKLVLYNGVGRVYNGSVDDYTHRREDSESVRPREDSTSTYIREERDLRPRREDSVSQRSSDLHRDGSVIRDETK